MHHDFGWALIGTCPKTACYNHRVVFTIVKECSVYCRCSQFCRINLEIHQSPGAPSISISILWFADCFRPYVGAVDLMSLYGIPQVFLSVYRFGIISLECKFRCSSNYYLSPPPTHLSQAQWAFFHLMPDMKHMYKSGCLEGQETCPNQINYQSITSSNSLSLIIRIASQFGHMINT